MLRLDDIRSIIAECSFEDFLFRVFEAGDLFILQASWPEIDIATGHNARQHSRKWLISPHMTRSEIVQTAFKLAMTAVEHRARETFKFEGRRVFGPHFDVDALGDLCARRRFDLRPKEGSSP